MRNTSEEGKDGSIGYRNEDLGEECPHCGRPNDVQLCVDCEKWSEVIIVQAKHGNGSYPLCPECFHNDLKHQREARIGY